MTRWILAFAVAVSFTGGAARAQPSQASLDNVYSVVDCLVERHDPRLERVLATVPGTMDADAPWTLAALDTCAARGRPMPAAAFYNRGAVAERLLYRDFARIGDSPRRAAVRVFEPVSDHYVRYGGEYARASLAMLDMAACVVRAEPQRSYDFFRMRRGSAAERAAIEALAPALSTCVTQNENIDLTPPIFRAFLAEAAYRVAAGRPRVFRAD
jgi:hypothetical protein